MAGPVIDYLDGNEPALALVLEESGTTIQAANEQGRRLRVPARRVWVRHDLAPDLHGFPDAAAALQREIDALRADVDLALLWETAHELGDALELADLADLYFGASDPVHRSAMLRALLGDAVYFTRKGDAFAPRTEKQVDQLLTAQQRRAEKEAYRAAVQAWMEEAVEADEPAVPDAMTAVLDDLEAFLLNDKSSEAIAVLEGLSGDRSAREAAYDLLVRTGRLEADANAMLVMAGIRLTFPDEVRRRADELAAYAGDDGGRVDFTHLPAFSIDDASTRDVDDAITLERVDGGVRVGIHIADVPHFIGPDDPLDVEARRRGTSVYMPTQTVPMFPGRLSHDLASLNQDVLRPAFSLVATCDAEGEVQQWDFVRSRVRVAHRMTYDEVDASLEGTAPHARHDDLVWLEQFTRRLEAARLDDGALILEQPELVVKVRDDEIQLTRIAPDVVSRRIVSELMILTNALAAEYAAEHEVPIIYRMQDAPEDPALIGQRIPYDPARLGSLLRGLRRSRFTSYPETHAALGLRAYTQVTSPIRRYPDLVLQRQLIAHLAGEAPPYTQDELLTVLATAESAQREAKALQRQASQFWALTYLERHLVGQEVEGILVKKHAGGCIVELADYGLKGLLPVAGTAQPGDRFPVRIKQVRPQRGTLRLEPVA